MADIFKRLKKTLFSLFQFYHDAEFFFIGSAVGRITFKKFFQLIDEYNLSRNDANAFLALQLKRDDYKQLPYSDYSFGHNDAAQALDYLKRYTEGPRLLAFIFKLHNKNDELKDWFAPLPETVPRLTFYFAANLLKHGLKKSIFTPESDARHYFNLHYKFDAVHFDKLIQPFIQTYKLNDERLFELGELAEIEQILINEKSPPASVEQQVYLLEAISDNDDDEGSLEKCSKLIHNLRNLDPNWSSLSVAL